jgi:hypothetical protein
MEQLSYVLPSYVSIDSAAEMHNVVQVNRSVTVLMKPKRCCFVPSCWRVCCVLLGTVIPWKVMDPK